MSRMTASGGLALMASSSSAPDGALAVTWAPDASSRSARLLRNSPESSAIANRMGFSA